MPDTVVKMSKLIAEDMNNTMQLLRGHTMDFQYTLTVEAERIHLKEVTIVLAYDEVGPDAPALLGSDT